MGLFGNILSSILPNLGQIAGVGYEIYKDQHLTGAQKEANQFSADQASLNRGFQAQQAELARDWQEEQYLKYNSPSAMMSQYRDAGLNPALMYQQGTSPASMSTSAPSGDSASSVSPPGGNLVGMIGELMKLSMLGEQKRALQLQNEDKAIDVALKEVYGGPRADAEIRQIEQAINESLQREGEAKTRSGLNDAMADLTKAQKDSELLVQAEKKWRKKFIEDYHMPPELAGDLVKAAATLVGAGIMSVSKVLDFFGKKKGTHTRSITEKQADGTTITDVFSNFPDM